jgi:hypothetical protein
MISKLRKRLNPSLVIATMALFAALGGGYATAFSGSGTLQKANAIPTVDTFTDLRTLNGFGTLQHECVTGDGGRVDLRFVNTSSHNMLVFSHSEEEDDFDELAVPASTTSTEIQIPVHDLTQIHISRYAGIGPTPDGKNQVDLTLNTSAGGIACGASSVLALNSIE